MKITLENREFELKANGYFMKKYQDTFKSNMMIDLVLASQKTDYMKIAQLTYCAIVDLEESFEEWLNSFETPCFLRPDKVAAILEYLTRDTEPSIKPEGEGKGAKKKKEQ